MRNDRQGAFIGKSRARHARRSLCLWIVAAIALSLVGAPQGHAYSVLAHEAIIDSAWDVKIRPLLLQRFPNATPDELRQAHGYAYGGSLLQDLGYYPHGSRFFSDLTHYVRSGDFVEALLRDAQGLDEYAFALGALAHYSADNDGHQAVNRAVPLLYPKLGKKFGNYVTYEDNPLAHLKTEFGFDVLEVAKGRYAPDAYHDFIGFEVSEPLLDRAFQDTYGIPIASIFGDVDKAIGSYRYTVRSTIPRATRIAWVLKKDEIQKGRPGITRKQFLYNLSRAKYRREWGRDYRAPGAGSKVLAFVLSLVPKIGPLKALTLRMPTSQTETMFMASFDAALNDYERQVDEERAGKLNLSNRNFDTGEPTMPGAYFMADEAYARLVDDLAKQHFQTVSAGMKSDILAYYSTPTRRLSRKRSRNSGSG